MNLAFSISALVLSLAALAYTVKLALVYHRFNEQIKDWAQSLDDDMRDAINRAARVILRDLDNRITEMNNNENNTITEENEDRD